MTWRALSLLSLSLTLGLGGCFGGDKDDEDDDEEESDGDDGADGGADGADGGGGSGGSDDLTGLGASIASGTITEGEGSYDNCNGGTGDEAFRGWIAPSSGTMYIDTYGSTYDTVLAVHVGDLNGEQVLCNDDWISTSSGGTFSATAGQRYVIVVDAYDRTDSGTWVLNLFDSEPSYWSGGGDSGF